MCRSRSALFWSVPVATGRCRLVPIKNEDLWRELDRLASTHDVVFTHVAGHAGHAENERCDELAVAAYQPLLARSRSNSR